MTTITRVLKRWKDEERNYIKDNYTRLTATELATHLDRHPEVVRAEIRKLKLLSPFLYNKNNYSDWLLDDSLETFYWTGFLLADGNFKKYKNEIIKIRCTLAEKDKSHLEKLADRFKTTINNKMSNGRPQVEISAIDTKIIPIYVKKFGLSTNKTYNPPTVDIFKQFTDEQLISVLIGFIDGDGCITMPKRKGRGNTIIVVSHSSWLDILDLFNEILYKKAVSIKTTIPHISNGYAKITWTKRPIIEYLTQFISLHNLPVLQRKWSRIN